MQAERIARTARPLPAFRLIGYALIAFGIWAAGFGSVWRESVTGLLSGYAITYLPEKYLPYWPFEPFLPLFVIALGVYLTARFKAT